MSAATVSSTNMIWVYVRLMGEGTLVFRPTRAIPIGPGTVRLVAPSSHDSEDEDWEYKPGSVVRIERRKLEGAEADVAVSAVE